MPPPYGIARSSGSAKISLAFLPLCAATITQPIPNSNRRFSEDLCSQHSTKHRTFMDWAAAVELYNSLLNGRGTICLGNLVGWAGVNLPNAWLGVLGRRIRGEEEIQVIQSLAFISVWKCCSSTNGHNLRYFMGDRFWDAVSHFWKYVRWVVAMDSRLVQILWFIARFEVWRSNSSVFFVCVSRKSVSS